MAMSSSQFNQKIREAQRRTERAVKQEVDRVNRANRTAVTDYNRKVEARNRREVDRVNRANRKAVDDHNHKVDAHNRREVDRMNRQRNAIGAAHYRPAERTLADRVHQAIEFDDGRDYDVFLSYARIDGEEAANELRTALDGLQVRVWFDSVTILPGRSQSLQMDAGLRKAHAGIALLTPAYLAGRHWTQRELGALLHKPTLIPVLHGVTFEHVKEYSGILPDLAGFTTADNDMSTIASKIAPAVLRDSQPSTLERTT